METINNRLIEECSICSEEYSEKIRPHVIIPCGHTYCKTCLEKLNSKKCPACRGLIKSTVANLLVLDLTTNLTKLKNENLMLRSILNSKKSDNSFNDETNSNSDSSQSQRMKNVKHYSNGNRYEGDLLDGNRTGHGILYFENGDRYEGSWLNDIRSGHGVLYWRDGNRFEGDYVDGKRTGNGIIHHENGDRFEGLFLNGMKHGEGTHYFNDGRMKKQKWLNDHQIEF